MSRRLRIPQKARAQLAESPQHDYKLIPTKRPHPLRKNDVNAPLLFLANGGVFTQDPKLPARLGQVAFRDPDPDATATATVARELAQNASEANRPDQHPPIFVPEPVYEHESGTSLHRAKRHKQSHRWHTEVIPRLVYPYMNLLRVTDNLHDDPEPCNWPCSCGGREARTLNITLVRFHRLSEVVLDVCQCTPASLQLIHMGFFPSAPCYPTLAVDIRVLDFVKGLFLRVAPNHRAWCETVEEFLAGQGYRLRGQDPLRRRFSNALQWYGSLKHATKDFVHRILEKCRSDLRSVSADESPASSRPSSPMSPYDFPPETSPPSSRPSSRVSLRNSSEEGEDDSTRSNSPLYEDDGEAEQKRRRTEEDVPPPLDRPSEYLRSRCPLCFGGAYPDFNYELDFDAIVCIDACFTQKHNEGGERDPLKQHPGSVFVPEEEVRSMEEHVKTLRPTAAKKKGKGDEEEDDGYDGSMKVPRSALDGCHESFTAADERRQKSSTQSFDSTALMALLCRHDRVLWIANMTSAGEKQHYVIALLNKLFQHLPEEYKVGLLYDIGCQLHRSCIKWDFLEEYLDRLGFAISVFHAFGHHWPCQLIYHPRKREGFGLSDGEGCERFWHSISRLILYLRVCGYYQRLYTLDSQVEHADQENLRGLGLWVRRKQSNAAGKQWVGREAVRESEYSTEFLREQWELQRSEQTKPLPRRSNKQGTKAVQEVMRLRESVSLMQSKREALESVLMDLNAEPWAHAEAMESLPRIEKAVGDFKKTLRAKERALGVKETQEVQHLLKSPFLRDRMNAMALKTRLMAQLRARKFQRDRLERSFRKQINERKLHSHIEQSVKRTDPSIQKLAKSYNSLVDKMEKALEDPTKCPPNAAAPRRIPLDKLFELDVDDDIWQDIGLTDEWDHRTPPPWLADDSVRAGIRGMLEWDRGEEELVRLSHERDAMQFWFAEEWAILAEAIERTGHLDVQHQLLQRRIDLLRLCCRWRHNVEGIDASEDVPDWGPTESELRLTQVDMTSELLDEEKWDSGEGTYQYQVTLENDDDDDAGEEDIDYDETDFNTVEAFDVMEPNEELHES
ncbi:hypothetical protein V5O48_013464 [Marasmius crinis-equi]|uniref:CxC1-like cysteine cluster associated with KDZ transposases domain-containing protein n=1 Tax=Marasmius crinis-equi TaxID=585013 RepID=A0ABR3F006_9AGAR